MQSSGTRNTQHNFRFNFVSSAMIGSTVAENQSGGYEFGAATQFRKTSFPRIFFDRLRKICFELFRDTL